MRTPGEGIEAPLRSDPGVSRAGSPLGGVERGSAASKSNGNRGHSSGSRSASNNSSDSGSRVEEVA